STEPPSARVRISVEDGTVVEGSSSGDGPVDAIFRAINAATSVEASLREFRVDAVTEGQDALGEVSVVVEVEGQTGAGQGVSTDIIEAAARAYVRALSVGVMRAREGERALGLTAIAE
ncbi:MAG TPA: alpha-isopropylmalate synthase regulatory domain-containing protein, partial [Solirubrobacteraceae bacterium]|nr:alpha-isopropylmalate synthase regulatory domain-containing protein [Solirubrobacteraceae bacterium]